MGWRIEREDHSARRRTVPEFEAYPSGLVAALARNPEQFAVEEILSAMLGAWEPVRREPNSTSSPSAPQLRSLPGSARRRTGKPSPYGRQRRCNPRKASARACCAHGRDRARPADPCRCRDGPDRCQSPCRGGDGCRHDRGSEDDPCPRPCEGPGRSSGRRESGSWSAARE